MSCLRYCDGGEHTCGTTENEISIYNEFEVKECMSFMFSDDISDLCIECINAEFGYKFDDLVEHEDDLKEWLAFYREYDERLPEFYLEFILKTRVFKKIELITHTHIVSELKEYSRENRDHAYDDYFYHDLFAVLILATEYKDIVNKEILENLALYRLDDMIKKAEELLVKYKEETIFI